jgi:hypothetical protein
VGWVHLPRQKILGIIGIIPRYFGRLFAPQIYGSQGLYIVDLQYIKT